VIAVDNFTNILAEKQAEKLTQPSAFAKNARLRSSSPAEWYFPRMAMHEPAPADWHKPPLRSQFLALETQAFVDVANACTPPRRVQLLAAILLAANTYWHGTFIANFCQPLWAGYRSAEGCCNFEVKRHPTCTLSDHCQAHQLDSLACSRYLPSPFEGEVHAVTLPPPD
jgi:hypothetical protein